jgi:hypothetical protein
MRARGAAVLAAAAVAATATAVAVLASAWGEATLVRRAAPAFALRYDAEALRRGPLRRGELARLEAGTGIEVVVRRLAAPRPDGAVLPVAAERRADVLRRELPGFAVRSEGHVPWDGAVAYRLRYGAAGGVSGQELLLAPATPRAGGGGDGGGVVVSLRRTRRAGDAAAAAARAAVDSLRLDP